MLESPDQLVWALEDHLSRWLNDDVSADRDGVIALKIDGVLVLVEPSTGGMPWVRVIALVAEGLSLSEDLLATVGMPIEFGHCSAWLAAHAGRL